MIKYVFFNQAANLHIELYNHINQYKDTAKSTHGAFWRLKVPEEDLQILNEASQLSFVLANTDIHQIIKRFNNWKKAKYYIQLLDVSSNLIKLTQLKKESQNEI